MYLYNKVLIDSLKGLFILLIHYIKYSLICQTMSSCCCMLSYWLYGSINCNFVKMNNSKTGENVVVTRLCLKFYHNMIKLWNFYLTCTDIFNQNMSFMHLCCCSRWHNIMVLDWPGSCSWFCGQFKIRLKISVHILSYHI